MVLSVTPFVFCFPSAPRYLSSRELSLILKNVTRPKGPKRVLVGVRNSVTWQLFLWKPRGGVYLWRDRQIFSRAKGTRHVSGARVISTAESIRVCRDMQDFPSVRLRQSMTCASNDEYDVELSRCLPTYLCGFDCPT